MERTTTFEHHLDLPVSADAAWAWHARPGAFDRLAPPWQSLRILRRNPDLSDGSELEFRIGLGPFGMRWLARHSNVEPGVGFVDEQIRGPFASWRHEHRFEAIDDASCRLIDRVDYRLPLSTLSDRLAGGFVHGDLTALFAWRRRVTSGDLSLHGGLGRRFGDRPRRVAISGLSGTIGRTLAAMLSTGGHHVVRIVRGTAGSSSPASPWTEVGWDGSRFDHPDRLEHLDAFVDLAGEPIAVRWTPARRRRILASRTERVTAILGALGELASPPKAFLCASGVGIYGDTGSSVVDENADTASADGFLADVARRWEAAAADATAFGARVAHLRFGIVLSPRGGALPKLLGPAPFGPLAIPGSGRQHVAWITLDDAAAAIVHAVHDSDLTGPVNVTAPQPLTMADLVRALGEATGRPVVGRVPAVVLRRLLGPMAEETVLRSTGAAPGRLLDRGFTFRDTDPVGALRVLLGRARGPRHGSAETLSLSEVSR
ncbi:MAG: TIGR01777 family oxidoreductase [Acidobacteriota bacterium]